MIIPESLLQRMHVTVLCQPLDGQNLCAIGLHREKQA